MAVGNGLLDFNQRRTRPVQANPNADSNSVIQFWTCLLRKVYREIFCVYSYEIIVSFLVGEQREALKDKSQCGIVVYEYIKDFHCHKPRLYPLMSRTAHSERHPNLPVIQ
ncbi:hypothetical protein J6590_013845 [Homalodisca vitripennis]|nr:hypothetical protein J6590_013845 [Homalodisca vitripennis]